MDIYQAKETFTNIHKGKKIEFSFDDKCHRKIEIMFLDGIPNKVHHIQYDKLKVNIDNEEPIYIPIIPHRETLSYEQAIKFINK